MESWKDSCSRGEALAKVGDQDRRHSTSAEQIVC